MAELEIEINGIAAACYVWPKPGQTTPVSKSAYVTRVTAPDGNTYVVGGGGYSLK